MPKNQTIFRCSSCDAQYPKWQGRCSECGSWGSIGETVSVKKGSFVLSGKSTKTLRMSELTQQPTRRISTSMKEVDRVLGGGFVPGTVYLIGGDPGIGKSTLLLQLLEHLPCESLYFSAEESLDQLKSRIDRLSLRMQKTSFAAESDCDTIIATMNEQSVGCVVIDSIQTLKDASLSNQPGSVSQIKALTAKLVEAAKSKNIAMFIVGHVTKSGGVAGPKTLEHLVDGVLYLEGDEHQEFRILRSTKNRFGSTDEIGVFVMDEHGFHDAKSPSEVFLKKRSTLIPGSVITPVVEGSRVFFLEYQALVARTTFGYPVRKSVGFDANRLTMLLAVLVKRLHLPLDQYDVHLNVAGGMRLQEPSCDIAAIIAVLSAYKNIALPANAIVFGEVGLAGEIRTVSHFSKRVHEAIQRGFKTIVCPRTEGAPSICLQKDNVKDLSGLLK